MTKLPAPLRSAWFPMWILLACATLLAGCGARSKIDRHVQRADEYFDQKDLERARLEYLNAYRAAPNNGHVRARLGLIYHERGELGPAFFFLNQAKESQPTNLPVRATLGTLYALAGQRDQAREEAEYLLTQDPQQGDAFLILASIASGTNEVRATRERFEKLSFPTNSLLQLALGNIRMRDRDLKGAEEAFKKAGSLDPGSPKFHLALGGVYWLQGQTNEADAEFKSAADLAPVKSGARLRWADFKFKTGQADAGKKILEETVEKAPDYAPALNSLAEIAVVEKRTNEAGAFLQKVLQAEPNNYNALRIRARLKMTVRDFPGALEDLQIMAKEYPKDPTAPYQMAAVLLASSETVKALAELDRALAINPNMVEATQLKSEILLRQGNANEAILELTKLIERSPQQIQAYYLLANAYRARGSTNDALTTYAKIAELSPRDPQPHHLAGLIFRQQGKTNEARLSFEAAAKIAPTYVAPADELIELDIDAGDFPAALSRVEGYLQKYPDRPTPHYLMAKVLAQQKKLPEAEAALLKAISVDTNYTLAHTSLAQLYVAQGKTDQAIAKYQEVADKNPKDFRSLFQLGMLREQKGEVAAALEIYEKIVAVDGRFFPALNNLAYQLGEQGKDLDRALELARRARELSPNDPFSADTLGWILYRRGDYAGALPLLQLAATRLGNQPEVLFHLGMAHYMTGSELSTREILGRVVKNPGSLTNSLVATTALKVAMIDPNKADDSTVADLEKMVAANPKDLFAHLRLAQIFGLRKMTAQARQHYEAALAINPKSIPVLAQFAGYCADRLNEPAKALELAKQARLLSPDPNLALEMGRVATRAGDYQWALPILTEALAALPGNPRAQLYFGLANFGVGRPSNALVELHKAASTTNDFAEKEVALHLMTLVELYSDPSLAAKAAGPAAAFLKTQPEFPPALLAMGIVAESQKNYSAAKEAYERALTAAPQFLPAQRQMAVLLGEYLADDNRAYDIGSKIRAQLSDDAGLSKTLGKISYRRGDYREAVRLLKDSASRTKSDADLLYHLGLAQFQVRDRQAKPTLIEAVALEANHKLADEARKVLADIQ